MIARNPLLWKRILPARDVQELFGVAICPGTFGTSNMPLRSRKTAPSPDRRTVAELLVEHGPIPGDEAARILGWNSDRWWEVINRADEWFTLSGKGWLLTECGREAVQEAHV